LVNPPWQGLIRFTLIITKPVGEPKYLGGREEELMKKRGRQTGKKRFTIRASLCGGGDLLKV